MRILGFSEKWDKLLQDKFTTFRFPRKDRDWQVGERVRIVYEPRRKGGGELLGIAEIESKYAVMIIAIDHPPDPICPMGEISEEDARVDGFESKKLMQLWMWDKYKRRLYYEPMNKLTLWWI